MKILNIFLGSLLLSVSLGMLSSCKNDSEDSTPTVSLTLDADSMTVAVGETDDFNIKTGNSGYRVFSENPKMVTAELQDTKVILHALNKGHTAVVLSDAKDNYKRVPIISLYRKLLLNKSEISTKMKLGNIKIDTIRVLGGNGGYKATVNNDIATVEVDSDYIYIASSKSGTATITITDTLNVSATVALTVETTTEAYTPEELSALMAETKLQFTFCGDTEKNDDIYRLYNETKDGLNLYGYNMYDVDYLKIWFSGDKSVGKKQSTRLAYKKYMYKGSFIVTQDSINFEIIKNDGVRIWAIYWYVYDNKLYYGNFCQLIEND